MGAVREQVEGAGRGGRRSAVVNAESTSVGRCVVGLTWFRGEGNCVAGAGRYGPRTQGPPVWARCGSLPSSVACVVWCAAVR